MRLPKNDPYWDIPLVTTLATPVIDLPGGDTPALADFRLTTDAPKVKPTKRGRKVAS